MLRVMFQESGSIAFFAFVTAVVALGFAMVLLDGPEPIFGLLSLAIAAASAAGFVVFTCVFLFKLLARGTHAR